MKNKILCITILLLMLFLFNVCKLYADEMEQGFKDICTAFAKESSETISPVGNEHAVSDTERENTFARQRKLFKEWQEQLKNLIKLNPKNIWADDAQYLISVLSVENPQQQAEELEYLLREYPNIHIEDWTINTIGFMLPSVIDELHIKLELCLLYKQLGNVEKLNQICEDSMKKFPEKAQLFEKILK